jgi:hypothetical protein
VHRESISVLTHPRRRLDPHRLSTPDANRAPDDGRGLRPKHVERLTGNNKVLYKVSSRNFFKIDDNDISENMTHFHLDNPGLSSPHPLINRTFSDAEETPVPGYLRPLTL